MTRPTTMAPKARKQQTFFQQLPVELHSEIFKYLLDDDDRMEYDDISHALRARLVCSHWNCVLLKVILPSVVDMLSYLPKLPLRIHIPVNNRIQTRSLVAELYAYKGQDLFNMMLFLQHIVKDMHQFYSPNTNTRMWLVNFLTTQPLEPKRMAKRQHDDFILRFIHVVEYYIRRRKAPPHVIRHLSRALWNVLDYNFVQQHEYRRTILESIVNRQKGLWK